MSCWHLYMIRTRRGAIYTGIATDVARRLAEHAASTARGAKALRGLGPFTLLCAEPVGDRGEAQRVEARVKRLPKADKEALAAQSGALRSLIRDCLGRNRAAT